MSDLRSEILEMVSEVNSTVTVTPDQSAESLFDLGLDSLDHASVLLMIEEKYEIKIPDEAAGELISVDLLTDYVAEQQA
jgi:acyl carrier protein